MTTASHLDSTNIALYDVEHVIKFYPYPLIYFFRNVVKRQVEKITVTIAQRLRLHLTTHDIVILISLLQA